MRQLKTMEALKADEKLSDIFDYYVGDLEVPEEGNMQDLLGGECGRGSSGCEGKESLKISGYHHTNKAVQNKI
jgi:hypothetical protein